MCYNTDTIKNAYEKETKMRDVNRIYPFCNELAQLWSKHPDLRFGQIMSNIARYMQMEHRRDMFFMEDDELMDVIRNQLR